jgi:integrase
VDSLNDEHAEALKQSGVTPPFVLYSARHTFLTRLGEAGADAYTIQRIGGHSDIRTSARYVHPTDERTQVAFDKLESYNAKQMQKVEDERKKEQVQ